MYKSWNIIEKIEVRVVRNMYATTQFNFKLKSGDFLKKSSTNRLGYISHIRFRHGYKGLEATTCKF